MSDRYEVGTQLTLHGEFSEGRTERPVEVLDHEPANRLGVRHVVRFLDDGDVADAISCDYTDLEASQATV